MPAATGSITPTTAARQASPIRAMAPGCDREGCHRRRQQDHARLDHRWHEQYLHGRGDGHRDPHDGSEAAPTAQSRWWQIGFWYSGEFDCEYPINAYKRVPYQTFPAGLYSPGDWVTAEGASSFHPGGANFAFCDGSVKFIKETISSWGPYNSFVRRSRRLHLTAPPAARTTSGPPSLGSTSSSRPETAVKSSAPIVIDRKQDLRVEITSNLAVPGMPRVGLDPWHPGACRRPGVIPGLFPIADTALDGSPRELGPRRVPRRILPFPPTRCVMCGTPGMSARMPAHLPHALPPTRPAPSILAKNGISRRFPSSLSGLPRGVAAEIA